MKTGGLLLVLFLGWYPLLSQYESGITYPDSSLLLAFDSTNLHDILTQEINATRLKNHVYQLASDEFEGRALGTPGNDLAAAYIAQYFENIGLSPINDSEQPYFQKISLTKSNWSENALSINGTSYRHLLDYLSFPNYNENLEFEINEVLFLGYGIETASYNDYTKAKVANKVIMILPGEPMDADSISYISHTKSPSSWTYDINLKLASAKRHGVKLVLIIEPHISEMISKNRNRVLGKQFVFNNSSIDNNTELLCDHIYISSTMAKEIIGTNAKKITKTRIRIQEKGKPCIEKLKTNLVFNQTKEMTNILGQNVIGYIKGTELPDEVVVVSAHFDHLGKIGRDIYNGANDDASGTAAAMEIAHVLSKAAANGIQPKRSILFVLFTGEEKGLLGSKYYVNAPIFPLSQTVADINIDMIGRIDINHTSDNPYIYVVGADRLSQELHDINEEMNQKYTALTLDYRYNDTSDKNRYYYRSDHYNFAEKGIPVIFYYNGTHVDYHKPTDDPELLDYQYMQMTTKLALNVVWEVANRTNRLKLNTEVSQ